MQQSDSNDSTQGENPRAVAEDENVLLYNCQTSNRFESGRGSNGEQDCEDNPWLTAKRRREKRKRQNTGSVEIEHFHSLNKEEQLSAFFFKISGH